eukprot:m.92095 g.92095  ORF g.92095 m.92095 type:complete len:210 (-) comp12014_c0_seq2:485-1114(-)
MPISRLLSWAHRRQRIESSASTKEQKARLAHGLQMAMDMHRSGRYEKSETVYRDVLLEARGCWGENSSECITVMSNLGLCLKNQHRLKEAEACLQEVSLMRHRVYMCQLAGVAVSAMLIQRCGLSGCRYEWPGAWSETHVDSGLPSQPCNSSHGATKLCPGREDIAPGDISFYSGVWRWRPSGSDEQVDSCRLSQVARGSRKTQRGRNA